MRTFYRHSAYYILLFLLSFLAQETSLCAQVTYNAAASYGLRKLNPSYTGNAIRIRRSCDNATRDIGFNSCGGLDTAAIRSYVLISNPLSALSTTSSAAFGLRKLSCSWSGNAIEVRRSSDNATLNIGFTSDGDLDTVAMKTFVGTGSAFVTTWYDQSGNGRNATQGNTARQPRIMNAGVIDRQNTRPAIYFPGMTYGLFTGNLNIFATNAMFNGVARVNTDVTYNAIINTTLANIPSPLDFYNNQVVVGNGGTYTFYTPSQNFNSTKPLGIWTYNATSGGGAVNMYYNSTSILSSTSGSFGTSNTPLAIGSRNDGTTGLNGWISEIVTFAAIPSATDRLFLEWTQSQYYNISGVTLGTIPAGVSSAYVTTWYDQSGNAQHLTQAAAANQPRIVNVGVISNQNNLPAIYLDGTNYYMSQSTLAFSNPYSVNAVATRTGAPGGSSGGYQRLFQVSATADGYGFLGSLSGSYATFAGIGSAWNDVAANVPATGLTLNSKSVLSMVVANGASGLVPYHNGTAMTAKDGTTAAATGFLLGAPYSGSNLAQLWTGNISECVIVSSAASTTRRRLWEANEAAYHNLTISNNKYTPPSALNYHLFVNGVGRETAADSIAGTRSSMGMGIKVGQTGTDFLKDAGDYITFGMGCPVQFGLSTANLPAGVVQRWANDWYVNKTDVSSNNGNITVYFDFSDYGMSGLPGTASQYSLLSRTTAAGTFTVVTGTTVSVSGDRVSFVLDASNLVTNRYYTIGTANISTAPLPIELISFKGNSCDKSVCLDWQTATEFNNDYFLVDRSDDALTFETIGKVASKAAGGNSQLPLYYSFMDSSPSEGTSYYRLHQFDVDGQSKKSSIVPVHFDPMQRVQFVVYPNPGKGLVNIDYTGLETEQEVFVSITDLQGRAVYSTRIDLQALSANTFKIMLPETTAKGVYFVLFEIRGIRYASKLVVE